MTSSKQTKPAEFDDPDWYDALHGESLVDQSRASAVRGYRSAGVRGVPPIGHVTDRPGRMF